MGTYFVLLALCAAWACKLSTPAAFFDPTPDNNEILKTMNVRAGGELYSGVVAGTLPSGVTGVDIKFDDGEFKKASIDGTSWKVFIPTGADAAAGKNRWQVGSKHSITLRARGANGNASSNYARSTFTRQQNKDVNGDGYADVIIGAVENQGGGATDKGVAYIFYGSASGMVNQPTSTSPYTCSGSANSNACTVIQNPENENFGSFGLSVSFAGDTNGDGYADVIVGAGGNQGGGAADKGVAYIFYGSATGMVNQPTSAIPYTCSGPASTNACTVIQNPDNESAGGFGYPVSFAGDTNGDGYADVIVGAGGNQGGGAADKGVAYIFYGSASGMVNQRTSASPYTCSGPASANACTVMQNPDNESPGSFGYSVSFAGDTNGDDYADVIVGAYQNQGAGASNKGVVYIFYGSASGMVNQPTSALPYACTGSASANACTVVQNPDNEANGYFGISVSFAGDMNSDGFADVIVGAYFNQGGGEDNKGVVYIFYGSASGIVNQPTSASSYTCIGPASANGCTVIQNPDNENAGSFGYSVSFAGDTNGDGYADVIAGAIANQGSGVTDKGVAYIFYGSASGIMNQPTSTSPYSCAGPAGSNACTVIQNPDNENGGRFGYSVSLAGDTNGDGYADLIIGADNNQGGGASNKGVAYIFYGSASGMPNQPASTSPYTCSGPASSNACTVIQNPDNEGNGRFGASVGYLWQPAERSAWPEFAPQQPAKPHQIGPFVGVEFALANRKDNLEYIAPEEIG